ncbi:MAG: M14 family zinc carboxypeptidase [Caldilineales bacterium]|nr:M14 family zinc carboxypeptidase [Caldilineales bacterium]
MKPFLPLLLLLALLPVPSAAAAPTPPPAVGQEPAVARIYVASEEQVAWLANAGLDLLEARGPNYLVALLRPGQRQWLTAQGFRIETDPVQTASLRRALQPDGPPGFACYRDVPTVEARLRFLAAQYPTLAELIDFGDSWEKATRGGGAGHDLWVLRITNREVAPPAGRSSKPRFFLMAAIHARELVTPEIALFFADWLLENYGQDPDITWVVDHHEVWIAPVTNPDGRQRAEQNKLWRKNTDNDDGCTSDYDTTYPIYDFEYYGVDLNRNHSFMWGGTGASPNACAETYRGPSAASEPEVQALEALMRALFPDQRGPGLNDPAPLSATGIMITLHSYGQLVLWPWGNREAPAPNAAGLQSIGRKFASYNGYVACQSGAPGCLYPVSGSTDDWAYGELGIPAFTFELGTEFFQPCPQVPDIWRANRPALFYAAKMADMPYVRGQGPETLTPVLSPQPVGPGQPLVVTATATDSATGGQAITLAEAYVGAPPWLGGTAVRLRPADGRFDSPREGVVGELDITDLAPGRYLVWVRARDAAGHWGPPTATWLDVARPDFAVQADPGRLSLCPAAVADLAVSVTPVLGRYDAWVSLSVRGTPPAATATVTPTQVIPPAAASLHLALTDETPPGAYELAVVGVGAEGVQRTGPVALSVLPASPGPPGALFPADQAVVRPGPVALQWADAGANVTYDLQVAADAGFADLAVDERGLTAPQYVAAGLRPGQSYLWRVRATNPCGQGPWSLPRRLAVDWWRSLFPLLED